MSTIVYCSFVSCTATIKEWKGVATTGELSTRKQYQSGDDMRRLLNCKYILRRRIHSYKFLQNTVEKNNDGISRYNPRYIVEI